MEKALKLYSAAATAPASGLPEARVRALRQDSLFALGRGQLALARAEEALSTARRGLALGRDETVFVANLLALEATALEALGRPLEALPSYEEAQKVHTRLLDRALAAQERR